MKKILLNILIIIMALTITGCGKKSVIKSEIKSEINSFSYNYGSYNGGYYNYSITTNDNKVTLIAEGYNGVELNINKEIDNVYLEQLSKIINNNKIYEWDGFDKRDNSILDGYSFELIINYKDGSVIEASGYMKYPKNYDTGHKALTDFLNSIK